MSCSGNPSNCSFCGNVDSECAKSSVTGCTAKPTDCEVCQGKGCIAVECTGNTSTCNACKDGAFTSCRKAQVSATEGIETARPIAS
ncbi:hypothetical protein IAT38_007226 [Cryptococcus sp. DSM 104549]